MEVSLDSGNIPKVRWKGGYFTYSFVHINITTK